MKPRRFLHKVEFLEKTESVNKITGERSYVWNPIEGLSRVPAQVLTGPGKEPIENYTELPEVTARINTKYFSYDYHSLMDLMIRWDGLLFNIEAVSTDVTGRTEYRFVCSDGLESEIEFGSTT